jgi:Tfp pilus assembly protein PilN
MPNINLIAARRADKKRVEQNTRRLCLGLAAEMGALVLLVSWVGARQISLRGALSAADAHLTRLEPTLKRIDQIEKDTGVLKPKLDTLVAAKADTLRWRAMLQIVSQSVPANAWLTGITSSGTGEDTTIAIAGSAGSQTLVGETMTRLGSFPVFDTVELRFTQLAGGGPENQVPRVNFEIGAHLKSTRPAEPAKTVAGTDGAAAGGSNQVSEGGSPDGKPNA